MAKAKTTESKPVTKKVAGKKTKPETKLGKYGKELKKMTSGI